MYLKKYFIYRIISSTQLMYLRSKTAVKYIKGVLRAEGLLEWPKALDKLGASKELVYFIASQIEFPL